jgi:hypothetical protein
MAREKNVTRFEFGRTRGWWVRIRRRNRKVQAFFSDGKHGGRAAALAKARRQRDRWLRTLPPPIDPRRKKASVRIYRDASSGYPAWRVHIRFPGGGVASTSRSIRLYGSSEAKRLCERWARSKVKQAARSAARSERTRAKVRGATR